MDVTGTLQATVDKVNTISSPSAFILHTGEGRDWKTPISGELLWLPRADAKGGDGPNLHRQGLTATFISATIKKGVPGDTPAFKKLSSTQLFDLVRYVGSLQ